MELVAISMDDVPNAALMAAATGARFPILSDARGAVVRNYGVYDLLGDGVAAPATFIVGGDGALLWRHVGENVADRPQADEILERLREVALGEGQ